jgi:3-phenylpropionate/cinnamic acid dioxygenase small subunit
MAAGIVRDLERKPGRDMSQVKASDASEILDLLARYAHVVDNRDWSEASGVFAPDVQLGRSPALSTGIERLRGLVGDAPATHGHNTTDVILDQRADGSVRAWSKFYIVRGDGTVGSGDYQDTLVHTAAGWRIAERDVSRGNRLDTDPTGGPSTRTFSFASWLD